MLGCVHESGGSHRHQIPLELELQVVISCLAWVLETECWTSQSAGFLIPELSIAMTFKSRDMGCESLAVMGWA